MRLTGSGLGCPDWPTCQDGQLAAPLEYHALVEYINRLITGLTALAVAAAVLGALFRNPKNQSLIYLAWGLVIGVAVQVVLGGIVVITHLTPWTVVSHFLLSMVLVLNAVVLHYQSRENTSLEQNKSLEPAHTTSPAPQLWRWLVRLLTGLTAGAVFLGTILTGAGPHGGDEDVGRFGLDISNLARIHAGFVIAFLIVLALGAWLVYRAMRSERESQQLKEIQQRGLILGAVALSQAFVGYIQYFNDVPELLVGIHIAGAALMWASMIYLHLSVCPPNPRIPLFGRRVNLQNQAKSLKPVRQNQL